MGASTCGRSVIAIAVSGIKSSELISTRRLETDWVVAVTDGLTVLVMQRRRPRQQFSH
jgi:hypothetical protein